MMFEIVQEVFEGIVDEPEKAPAPEVVKDKKLTEAGHRGTTQDQMVGKACSDYRNDKIDLEGLIKRLQWLKDLEDNDVDMALPE